jgi:hypothetical protein
MLSDRPIILGGDSWFILRINIEAGLHLRARAVRRDVCCQPLLRTVDCRTGIVGCVRRCVILSSLC